MVALRRLPRGSAVRIAALSFVPLLLAGAWRAWTAWQGADVEQVGAAYDPATLARNALLVLRGVVDLATYRQWPPLLFVIAVGVMALAAASAGAPDAGVGAHGRLPGARAGRVLDDRAGPGVAAGDVPGSGGLGGGSRRAVPDSVIDSKDRGPRIWRCINGSVTIR